MHGRCRCRQRGAENDRGGQRRCCPARHFRISGLSCRGLAPQRADDRGPVVPWQQMGIGTDDAKRLRKRQRSSWWAGTTGATNRDGRARALQTDNSIVAVVTRS
jgi:hypothetical protein